MAATTPLEEVILRAGELARDGVGAGSGSGGGGAGGGGAGSGAGAGSGGGEAAQSVLAAAGGNRRMVEAARDQVADRVRARVDDFEATGMLQVLNRVLGDLPIDDPLDWRVRWTQRFRKP